MKLHDFDVDAFLRDYWQQKPLLVRGAWAGWTNPLDPDELAGLAGEEMVESRLVTLKRSGWTMEEGPVAAGRFARLGKQPWTLLVQAVDHHVPAVAALRAAFRFVPNWRVDDVMVSYASDGGGVGPHYDQYDVFLIQGLGRRRWQVGGPCDAETALLPHDDLRLLAAFEAVDEWVLEPGDMLYLPPRVAHNGVAVGDGCMTYSMGFRAPARSELIAHYADHLLSELGDDDRYGDAGLRAQDNPGEIAPDALAALHAMVTERLADRPAFARWFGSYSSTPKYPEVDWTPDTQPAAGQVRAALSAGAMLRRNPASRFMFVRDRGATILFVDGTAFDCAGPEARFAEQLCAGDTLAGDPEMGASPAVVTLVTTLIGQGCLSIDGDG